MSNQHKLSIFLVVFGLLFWLVETWFFGFNQTAQSTSEGICDWIGVAAVLIGFIIKPVEEINYFNGCTFKQLAVKPERTKLIHFAKNTSHLLRNKKLR